MSDHRKIPNRLIKESSPYLLQHAYNPVDWYPWGEEAIKRARKEDKPILVSIGYSSCHWCHVMERESFEDESTAAIMNEHFVNIKIDREERPDLDHIYMDAVQAMSGSGGWPLNVFLTPDLKPFYGGTYFPPVNMYNRSSWKDVLSAISKAFNEKRNEIESQAANLTDHLANASTFGLPKISVGQQEKQTNQEDIDLIFRNIMKNADKVHGGFGRAPKFPSTFLIQFLLQYYYFSKDEEALQQACLSLDKMIAGGIYDHIGGGFARYSTDAEWLVPHFEKMLYDNALLIIVMSEAYQLTKKESYRETIIQTLGFIKREFTSPEGGFYAALDADSEGEEGKYYVWSREEVDELLGEEADLFCLFYDITSEGNWHEQNHQGNARNIPRTKKTLSEISSETGIGLAQLKESIGNARTRLLDVRSKRKRPGLDDKILLGWNALMNKAYSKAFAAVGLEEYRQTAIRNMKFMLDTFMAGDGGLFHTYKSGETRIRAFLDDHVFLADALIQLQEITGNKKYLSIAKTITEKTVADFSDPLSPFFYFTSQDARDVIVRKKEIYDGATTSGNSLMAGILHYLGIIFENKSWLKQAGDMLAFMEDAVTKYSTSFAVWAQLLQQRLEGTREIVVVGPAFYEGLTEIGSRYLPCKVVQGAFEGDDDFPLLRSRGNNKETLYFLCRDYSCKPPERDFTKLLIYL